MRSLPISNHTRRLGAPPEWDHEKRGICHTLEILDADDGAMISAWEMTDAERKRIADGAPLYLHVYGGVHPVVGLSVGDVGDSPSPPDHEQNPPDLGQKGEKQ